MKNPWTVSLTAAAILALVALAPAAPAGAQDPAPVMVITPQDPPAPQDPDLAAEARLRRKLTEAQVRLEERLARAEAMRLRDLERELARIPEELEAGLYELEHDLQAHAEAMAALAAEAQEGAHVFVDAWTAPSWLGVSIVEVTAEKASELRLPAERGVLVTEVQEESPAAKAGLAADDVITEYNGQRVEGVTQFMRMVRETPAGRTAQLTVWRGGRSQTLTAELGSHRAMLERRAGVLARRAPRPPRAPRVMPFQFSFPEGLGVFRVGSTPLLGIQAEDVRGQFGEFLGAPEGEGVLVRDVREESPAAKAGMRVGDIIVEVGGKRVRRLSELRSELSEQREEKSVAVKVVRRGQEVSLNVEIEQPRPPAGRVRPVRRTTI